MKSSIAEQFAQAIKDGKKNIPFECQVLEDCRAALEQHFEKRDIDVVTQFNTCQAVQTPLPVMVVHFYGTPDA